MLHFEETMGVKRWEDAGMLSIIRWSFRQAKTPEAVFGLLFMWGVLFFFGFVFAALLGYKLLQPLAQYLIAHCCYI